MLNKRSFFVAAQLFVACAQLFVASPAAAQTAPDRSSAVSQIVSRNTKYFTGDDGRRELLVVIACELNKTDAGNWGRLAKNDRGGFIPADILVWKPTLEHFDVLTDSGAMWNPDGPIQPSWAWSPVNCAGAPVPTPDPGPVTPPVTPDLDELKELRSDLGKLSAVAAIHWQIIQELQNKVVVLEQNLREADERLSSLLQFDANALNQQQKVLDGLMAWLRAHPIPDGCKVAVWGCRPTFNYPPLP